MILSAWKQFECYTLYKMYVIEAILTIFIWQACTLTCNYFAHQFHLHLVNV